MRRWGLLFVLIAVMGAGCGQAGVEEAPGAVMEEAPLDVVELKVFYPCDDVNWVATIEELGEDFMRENPDVMLNMQSSDKGIYTENLKIKAALHEFPDIMQIRDPQMFLRAGKLGEIPEEISGLVENPYRFEGKTYAVPLYNTTYGIVYNQVIFKKYGIQVPRSYQDFIEVCERLRAEGVVPLAIGGSKEDNLNYWFHYFFQSQVLLKDPEWLNKKGRGKVSFGDGACLEMLEKYKGLLTSSYILEDSMNMNDNQLVTKLVNGEVAMIFTGPFIFSQLIDAYPQATESDKTSLGEEIQGEEDKVRFRLGWFFMPDEAGKTVVVSEGGASFAISAKCAEDERKLEAATEFFRYFYERSNYRDILRSMYAIPTTREAVLYPAVAAQQKLLVDYRYAEKSGDYIGNHETPEGFREYLSKILNSIVTDMISIQSASEKLDAKWKELSE